jgi:hypothetical protein
VFLPPPGAYQLEHGSCQALPGVLRHTVRANRFWSASL